MANAACKLLRCGNQLAALINSAAMNAPMEGENLQTLLDSQMTAAEQQALIDDLNKGISVFTSINDTILA